MKKSKKILALLLAVIMLVTVVPLTVFAESGGIDISKAFAYEIMEDGTAKITAFSGGFVFHNPVIPSEIDGYSVTCIGNGAFSRQYGDKVWSVTIPDSVTTVEEKAFWESNDLFEINVSENNTKYCSVDGVLFSKDKTELVAYPKRKGNEYQIPNGVTRIGNSAFDFRNNLTKVDIPESVTEIGNYAFSNCCSLERIDIPNGVAKIGEYAFRSCSMLTEISIPNVTVIEDGIFLGCELLKNIKMSNNITSIGYEAFDDTAFMNAEDNWTNGGALYVENYLIKVRIADDNTKSEFSVRNGTKVIAGGAFKGCRNFLNIKIPNSVISIGSHAFEDCDSLKSVIIPDSITDIGEFTFRYCSSLKNITIPNNIVNIGRYAFAYCYLLEDITIGKGVVTIDEGAFYGCSDLKSVTIPANVKKIGSKAFGWVFESDLTKNRLTKIFGIAPYGGEFLLPNPDFTIYGVKGTEAEKYAKDNEFKFIEITESIPGDISGDGVVSADDAIVIQHHIAGLETLGEAQLKNADLNGDGIVDEGDAIAILRIDAGLAS